jgi:hypothetical protein
MSEGVTLALVTVQLPLAPENEILVDRILEVTTLFATIHVLVYLAPPATSGLFATNFWQMLLFAAIGFCAYYLVVKKVIRFKCIGPNEQAGDVLSPLKQLRQLRQWLKDSL